MHAFLFILFLAMTPFCLAQNTIKVRKTSTTKSKGRLRVGQSRVIPRYIGYLHFVNDSTWLKFRDTANHCGKAGPLVYPAQPLISGGGVYKFEGDSVLLYDISGKERMYSGRKWKNNMIRFENRSRGYRDYYKKCGTNEVYMYHASFGI